MIRRDLKNMKKRRAAICFLMVFIMSFTLLPSGVFAAQNDSLKAKQQLAEQSKKFDELFGKISPAGSESPAAS